MSSPIDIGLSIHSLRLPCSAPPPSASPAPLRCVHMPLQLAANNSDYHHLEKSEQRRLHLQTPRRSLLLSLLSFPPLFAHSPSAAAFTFGIPGPKEWLRDQKKKSAKYVLAPIDASRQSLRDAYILIDSSQSPTSYSGEVRRLLNSAARDCVAEDRNSVVVFQASTGVEVCTFRLILNNAASLLDDRDPVKVEAEVQLSDLVRSFSSLSGVVNTVDFQLTSEGEKVKDGLMDAIDRLNKFEQSIKDCLGI